MSLWLYYRYGFYIIQDCLKKYFEVILKSPKFNIFIFIYLEKRFLKQSLPENSLFLPLYKNSDFL